MLKITRFTFFLYSFIHFFTVINTVILAAFFSLKIIDKSMFQFMQKTKKSFSLLELSVVIVIISILLATVITSKILIDRAKTNQYFAVMVAYKTSINIFNNTWGFLPGDASNSDLLGTAA